MTAEYNDPEEKLTCGNIDCPCQKYALNVRNEGAYFTHADEEECNWDKSENPKCNHAPQGTRHPGGSLSIKKLSMAGSAALLIILLCFFFTGGNEENDSNRDTSSAPRQAEELLLEHFNTIFTVLKR